MSTGLTQLLQVLVDPDEEGLMIREVIRRRWPVSNGFLRRLKRDEGIWRNGEPAFLTERVLRGDRIQLAVPAAFPEHILPEPIPLHILYEDDWLMVVDKPPGIVVHPTKGHPSGTLANGIVHHWLSRKERPGFHLVQRLDRDTSGLLVIAKNAFAHQQLALQMSRGRLKKGYMAVVEGRVSSPKGVIEAPIWREPGCVRRLVDPRGKPARTAYQVERLLQNATLLRLKLLTGRTHQIRVHLAYLGHPLFGDALYGGNTQWIQRQALHAAELRFEHPAGRYPMSFRSCPPEDIQRLLDFLAHA